MFWMCNRITSVTAKSDTFDILRCSFLEKKMHTNETEYRMNLFNGLFCLFIDVERQVDAHVP